MNIKKLLQENSHDKIIEKLKDKKFSSPDLEKLQSEYQSSRHNIFDFGTRPDKAVKDNEGNLIRYEKVARIAIPMQKLIVDRAVAFLFGKPVQINSSSPSDAGKIIADALRLSYVENKIDSHNRKIARILMSETEVAELWYTSYSDSFWKRISNKYPDFKFNYIPEHKIKTHIFAPSLGDKLYPIFDSWGDMVAFSREYTQIENNNKAVIFETYTKDEIVKWANKARGWELIDIKTNFLGKIPVVYARQNKSEWAEVQPLIERLEKLLSNFADTNDYHSSPKIFVTGEIRGFAQKGETGAIIEGEANATASYLSWQHAPESVRLEIETLLKMIHTSTQTPDISFDSVKGLGSVSGVALKMLFMDAHLKVNNKLEIFDEFLERRNSIVKSFIGLISADLKDSIEDVEISSIIEPFMIDDKFSSVQSILSAAGGKPILSQKSAIAMSGLAKNADEEFDLILSEKPENQQGLFNM